MKHTTDKKQPKTSIIADLSKFFHYVKSTFDEINSKKGGETMYEEYDYGHMAYISEIKLKVIKALQHLEDETSCSKEEAARALKEAIHYLVNEELSKNKGAD